MSNFTLLTQHGVFGGGLTIPSVQMTQLHLTLFRPDGTPWTEGWVRARINRDCRVLTAYPGTTYTHYVSTRDEVVLKLDENGEGYLNLWRQACLVPTDGSTPTRLTSGTPLANTAYNPYYILTFPDLTTQYLVPPNSDSAEMDDYLWNPTVVIIPE
jgi:hypothetical protein